MATPIILPTLLSMNRKQHPLVSFAVPMNPNHCASKRNKALISQNSIGICFFTKHNRKLAIHLRQRQAEARHGSLSSASVDGGCTELSRMPQRMLRSEPLRVGGSK